MPPHCDSMDGPVVTAATRALEAGDVKFVLPFVPKGGEPEVTDAFDKVVKLRAQGPEAKEVADLHFFETVVRIHRAGEGEPYTGLKPAGLTTDPVIPAAERAIESGSADGLIRILCDTVEAEVQKRLDETLDLKSRSNGDVDANRRYVEAMLGLEVYSHKLHECAKMELHEAHHRLQ